MLEQLNEILHFYNKLQSASAIEELKPIAEFCCINTTDKSLLRKTLLEMEEDVVFYIKLTSEKQYFIFVFVFVLQVPMEYVYIFIGTCF